MIECLTPDASGKIKSKRQFQIEIQDRMKAFPEFHILKFEVDRIIALFYSPYQDAVVITQYIWKLFTIPVIDDILSLFEVVASIKPVFESQKSGFHDIGRSFLNVFYSMFTTLISVHRGHQ
jgi:hypothetical protein